MLGLNFTMKLCSGTYELPPIRTLHTPVQLMKPGVDQNLSCMCRSCRLGLVLFSVNDSRHS